MALGNGELEHFLTGLERLHKEGKTHVCVIPFCIEVPHLVGEYSWVAEGKDICAATEHVEDGAKLFVAARNYTLHKYLVSFNVAPQSSFILLKHTPGRKPEAHFSQVLPLAPNLAIRSPGDAVCKGCSLSVEETFDPTVGFECQFTVSHDGTIVGRDTGYMHLLVRADK